MIGTILQTILEEKNLKDTVNDKISLSIINCYWILIFHWLGEQIHKVATVACRQKQCSCI